MSFGNIAIGAGAIIGGGLAASASNKASKRASQTAQAGIDSQERIYNDQVDRFEPYRQVGLDAIPNFYQMLGLQPTFTPEEQKALDYYDSQRYGGGTTPLANNAPQPQQSDIAWNDSEGAYMHSDGRYASLQEVMQSLQTHAGNTAAGTTTPTDGTEIDQQVLQRALAKRKAGLGTGEAPPLSPLAQWQLTQANRAQGRADSARGISTGGGASARTTETASAIAGQDYMNQYSRILDALKLGTNASSAMGSASQQFSNQIGQNANTQAQLQLDQGNTNAQLWSGLSSLPMDIMTYKNKTGGLDTNVGSGAGLNSVNNSGSWGGGAPTNLLF